MKRLAWIIVLIVVCVFGSISFIVQRDYGWNWDASQHFIRGQAYLRYLTGGTTSSAGVTPYQGRESYFENNPFDITWLTKVIGHPPTTDIILASVNQLFYKRLGLLQDMEAYHMYGVVITFLAALVVGIWSYQINGWIAAVISVTVFYGFPLLFSEQHFNFKDPAVMAYNTIFLYLFWLGITKRKSALLLLSAVAGGISLGTKFNILFLAPVLCLWLFWYAKGRMKPYINVTLIFIPVIMIAILYLTYPFLWHNFLPNMISLVDYYRQIGGNRCPFVPLSGFWLLKCSDWQTIRLFIVTIPAPTLLLSGIGSIAALASIGMFEMAPLLWLLVLSSIIVRVVIPINSLYGGSLRQVLEFIAPMSLLAGFAVGWLIRRYKHRTVIIACLVLAYIPLFFAMRELHPNENLYTNIIQRLFWKKDTEQFINGIVSYGNGYKPGIDWINSHAEKDAKVSLLTGLDSAIPKILLRPDINFGVRYWSGYDKKGEYLIELIESQGQTSQTFPYKYADNTLQPVYEKKVKGFPIVRVWKNDIDHVKPEFRSSTVSAIMNVGRSRDEAVLQLSAPVRLQTLLMTTADAACTHSLMNSYVLVSADGIGYRRMYETVQELNPSANFMLRYPFAGETGEFIKLFTYSTDSCDYTQVRYSVTGFK